MCAAARAIHYLHQGCTGFVAYIMDTREEGKVTVDDVPVVWEYPDVFSEDLHGVPPKRQVKFRIGLVLGATSIAKAPYRLAPPKMHDLST